MTKTEKKKKGRPPKPIPPPEPRKARSRGQRDPVWWVRNVLGDDPWGRQCEILESVRDHRRTAVRSCHGAGKSWLAARVALWFLYNHEDAIVATTAPTFRQVKRIIWQEIRYAHSHSKFELGGDVLQTELVIRDKWYAFGFTTDKPDTAQGIHADHMLVVIDEASGVPEDLWTAIDGILSSENARLLSIGNPTDPMGPFAKEFKIPGTSKIRISAFDTPNVAQDKILKPGLVTKQWVEDKKKRWGEASPMYRARVMAEFPEDADDALIPLPWIEAAQHRTLQPSLPNELSVDVARFGGDETVILHRRGPVIRMRYATRESDTMQLCGRIVRALADTKASRVKVDAIGIGSGVVDRLNELNAPVWEANASKAAKDREHFANCRAEWFWNLRQMFESGDIDIDPSDEDLSSQLSSLRYKINSQGRVLIESKDVMKARGLPSPDRADALAITTAAARPSYANFELDPANFDDTRVSPWAEF